MTVGGAQTNHGRLTAAVAAKYGLKCAILAIDDYPGEVSSNLLLDRIMGAQVFMEKPQKGVSYDDQLNQLVVRVQDMYAADGETVYFIPMGGSGVVGIPGYYNCAMELSAQVKDMGISQSRLLVSVGSNGYLYGTVHRIQNEGLPLDLEGIAIAPFL